MTANIFGERFLGHREPAWHGLGRTFDAPIGALEAIVAVGADFQVNLVPVGFQVDGVWTTIDGKVAVVREPTPDDPVSRSFAVVTDRYHVVQNTEIGEILDPLTDKWPVETVGVLGQGETLFVTLATGESVLPSFKDERMKDYLLITDKKDGSAGLTVAIVKVRVVCQNTLNIALRGSSVKLALPHTHTVKDRLAKKVLTHEQIQSVFAAAYPAPAGNELSLADDLFAGLANSSAIGLRNWREDRAGLLRQSAEELLVKFNDEFPKLADTAWAALNVVVEQEDYREGRDNIPVSAMFGGRADAKRRAYQAVRSL